MKVWFQNRRTKHKREETEGDQPNGNGHMQHGGGRATMLEEEEDDEDIDCE